MGIFLTCQNCQKTDSGVREHQVFDVPVEAMNEFIFGWMDICDECYVKAVVKFDPKTGEVTDTEIGLPTDLIEALTS